MHPPVKKSRHHDQRRPEEGGRRKAQEHTAPITILACDHGREDEMQQANQEVRDPEEHSIAAKSPWHRQGDTQHHRRRSEHCQPDATLVDIDRASEPGVGRPRPPDRRKNERRVQQPMPRRVVREQTRYLRDREHEDEVEEELKRRDLVLTFLLPLKPRT
jgi:hypothetical protein